MFSLYSSHMKQTRFAFIRVCHNGYYVVKYLTSTIGTLHVELQEPISLSIRDVAIVSLGAELVIILCFCYSYPRGLNLNLYINFCFCFMLFVCLGFLFFPPSECSTFAHLNCNNVIMLSHLTWRSFGNALESTVKRQGPLFKFGQVQWQTGSKGQMVIRPNLNFRGFCALLMANNLDELYCGSAFVILGLSS